MESINSQSFMQQNLKFLNLNKQNVRIYKIAERNIQSSHTSVRIA